MNGIISQASDLNRGIWFNWNNLRIETPQQKPAYSGTFFDETLRDGLQNPSVYDPSIGEKIRILHLMESLVI